MRRIVLLEWNPWSVPGFAVGLAVGVLAYVVYRSRPHRRQNQLLALLLLSYAAMNVLRVGVGALLADIDDVVPWQYAIQWIFILSAWIYILFFSTLDSPLAHPLRKREVRGRFKGAA